jgi:acylphosphatase
MAHRLGVYGYVQNQADGTVKVVCEGPGQAVARMAEWLETGPPSARVLRVDIQWSAQVRGYSAFTVEF